MGESHCYNVKEDSSEGESKVRAGFVERFRCYQHLYAMENMFLHFFVTSISATKITNMMFTQDSNLVHQCSEMWPMSVAW